MASAPPELELLFTQEQLRITTPRLTVFEAMRESELPLSIADLTKKCPSVDRGSIYRTIELFVSLNIAEAVPVGWKQRYELTSPFKSHHHHLYCTACGKLVDIHSKKLEELVTSIAGEYDFHPTQHKFEVSGLCSDCQKK